MLQKIDPKTLTMNPFTLIGDQWMLITAGTPEHCNTMTASWGGVGVLWAEPSRHLLYPSPALYQGVRGQQRLFHPLFLR